jgi:hypothetical protein
MLFENYLAWALLIGTVVLVCKGFKTFVAMICAPYDNFEDRK